MYSEESDLPYWHYGVYIYIYKQGGSFSQISII